MKESIGKYIAGIHRSSQGLLEKKLKGSDVKRGQYDFLFVIGKHEGINLKELSLKLKIGKSTTTKAVNSLIKSGYIKREVSIEDKRNHQLYLTDKGKEFKEVLDKAFKEMVDVFSKDLSDEQYDMLIRTLKTIIKNIDIEREKN